MRIPGAVFRKFLPAAGVAAVLAASLLGPIPSLASSTNNCGVKGYGYHDHGKVCPNRPFPGHGNGVLAKLGLQLTVELSVGHAKHANLQSTTNTSVGATTVEASGSAKHGRGNAYGHAKAHERRGGQLTA